MAFLCPVRIRNQKTKKKKKVLDPITIDETGEDVPQFGRITGSSSVETLVRVGLEKANNNQQLHLVLHDFTPCVDDELEVKRGDLVSLLYRENDWAYVAVESDGGSGGDNGGREGFIPFSYLSEYKKDYNNKGATSTKGKKEASTEEKKNQKKVEEAEIIDSPNVQEFCKSPHPIPHITLYSFTAVNENDLSIARGDIVTVLNKDDPDWFWVSRCHDNTEGFVPSAFIFPLNYFKEAESQQQALTNKVSTSSKGTELVMLYDYKAQAPDDLSVKRGDWVYADLECQSVEGWLWAWAPRQRKYGFLPRAYARVPAMTSL